jgi:hypothetical protein
LQPAILAGIIFLPAEIAGQEEQAMKPLITQEEAARILDVTVYSVANYRKRGVLDQVNEDGRVKVTLESVERLKIALDTMAGNRDRRRRNAAA